MTLRVLGPPTSGGTMLRVADGSKSVPGDHRARALSLCPLWQGDLTDTQFVPSIRLDWISNSLNANVTNRNRMAIRKIARMGHEVLKAVARPIEDPGAPEIARLAGDLIDTCEDVNASGIAASQIYEPLRMFVYRVRKSTMPAGAAMQEIPWTVCINPEIEVLTSERELYWERCLSLPGIYGQVPRPTQLRIRWSSLDGVGQSMVAYRQLARLLQHECDHLDGVLYPMRMQDMSTLGYVSELGPALSPSLPRDAADFVDPNYDG